MERSAESGNRNSFSIPRWLLWTAGLLLLLLLLAILVRPLIEEPIRATIEGQMNENLEGYSVTLPSIDLYIRGLSISLNDLTIVQDAYPDRPVAQIPVLNASVQWRRILQGRLVADFLFVRPEVYLNLEQLRAEADDDVAVEERGWAEALEAAYFLDFNLLRVHDGELIYIDDDPDRPLHVTGLRFRAEDIRGSPGPEDKYPSPFHLEAVVFGSGHVTVEGQADFLAEPTPELRGRFQVRDLPLDHFRPVLARANVILTEGIADGAGEMELAHDVNRLHIEDLVVRKARVDYVYTGEDGEDAAGSENENGAEVAEDVVEGPDPEALQLRIEQVRLEGEFGLVNEAQDPSYRVFLYDTTLTLENYSNHFLDGPGEATLEGYFMGYGRTLASATFRPEQEGPDFDIEIDIAETHLPAMNDILQAYGNFDVVDGHFAFSAEFTIQEGHIEGFMRPFFGEMEVYDQRDDDEKGAMQQLYERVVGIIANILENLPRDEVATHVDISGPLDDPDASTWQVITGLLRNAFFQAILPGFEGGLTEEEEG